MQGRDAAACLWQKREGVFRLQHTTEARHAPAEPERGMETGLVPALAVGGIALALLPQGYNTVYSLTRMTLESMGEPRHCARVAASAGRKWRG